jgi:hypothetical protein
LVGFARSLFYFIRFWDPPYGEHRCTNLDGLYPRILPLSVQSMGVLDNSEPHHDSFDDPKNLTAILDEFLTRHGEDRAPGALRRALPLNDVWAAFDLATGPEAGADGTSLRRRLARVIGRLHMQSSQIADLPDNYAQAVKSGAFAADFDPGRPDRAFLPPDLLDTDGQWVEIGEDGLGPVTPFHLDMLSGRSVFRVFIHCRVVAKPHSRISSRSICIRHPGAFKPADIATRTSPRQSKERWDPLRLDLATPQLPQGTIVALVRQMMVINDELKPSPTSVTQKVKFRVFKDIGKAGRLQDIGEFNSHQLVYELVKRRRDLLA